MNELALTRHAEARMAQRAISPVDLDLALLLATEVDDGYLVRRKDCVEAVRALKPLMNTVEKLANKRLVIVNGRVVTAYRATARHSQMLTRTGTPSRRRISRQAG